MAVRRLALALGVDGIRALSFEGGREIFVPFALPANAEDPGAALRQGLGLLEQALSGGEGGEAPGRLRLSVALLPPLCETRLVDLPPLGREEAEVVLRRDAARHFLGRGRSLVVGGARMGRGPADPPPVLAAAAPRALLDALQRAVDSRGWVIERIVPAHAAWLRALDEAAPSQSGAEVRVRLVVAVVDDSAHMMLVAGDQASRIRRVPAHDIEGVLEAVGAEAGRALVLAGKEAARPLREALRGAGWVLLPADPADVGAAVEASRHTAEALPELVPAPLAWARRERDRSLTVRMLAASVVLVAAAAIVHLWGAGRELSALRSERMALREVVAPALAARDSLDAALGRVAALEALGHESARLTFSLVELAVLLPPETYLVSLRAAGDTAVFEAAGGRAGDALAALRAAPTLRDVRIEGPIQRDIEGGATSRERFTLSAILSHRGDPPVAASSWTPNGEGGSP